ncbi:hypothetical protein D3C72_1725700 [compost metagenome]
MRLRRRKACLQRAFDFAQRDGIHVHARFAHQCQQVNVRIGLLREAHGVKLRQLGDARADGGRVIHPQWRAVFLGELGEGGVWHWFHGGCLCHVVGWCRITRALPANPICEAGHDAVFLVKHKISI